MVQIQHLLLRFCLLRVSQLCHRLCCILPFTQVDDDNHEGHDDEDHDDDGHDVIREDVIDGSVDDGINDDGNNDNGITDDGITDDYIANDDDKDDKENMSNVDSHRFLHFRFFEYGYQVIHD